MASEIAAACSRMDELHAETEQILNELKDITVKLMQLSLCSVVVSSVAFHNFVSSIAFHNMCV